MSVQVSLSIRDDQWEKLLEKTDYTHQELKTQIRKGTDKVIENLLE